MCGADGDGRLVAFIAGGYAAWIVVEYRYDRASTPVACVQGDAFLEQITASACMLQPVQDETSADCFARHQGAVAGDRRGAEEELLNVGKPSPSGSAPRSASPAVRPYPSGLPAQAS